MSANGSDHPTNLQESAKRHMWLHFSRMSSYAGHDMPLIVRGEGPYVFDEKGKRFAREVSGFHARVVQHECDHLDGILYPMRIRDLAKFGLNEELFPNMELPPED